MKETGHTAQGTKLWKMEEIYRGREVFDVQLTIETDAAGSEVLDATGTFVQVTEDYGVNRDREKRVIQPGRSRAKSLRQGEMCV